MSSIKQIRLKLNSNKRLYANDAYALYSELLRNIDAGYADYLHEQNYSPVSQYINIQNDRVAEWVISLLSEEADIQFSQAVANMRAVHLEDRNIDIIFAENHEEKHIDFKSIVQSSSEITQKRTMKFITPSSFKSDGRYVIFPNQEIILKGLLAKWNYFCSDYSLDDEDMKSMLLSGVSISGYQLESCDYRMKGISIPSFYGSIKLRDRLSLPLRNILQILLAFSEFSGVGIKTALGMGGIKLL